MTSNKHPIRRNFTALYFSFRKPRHLVNGWSVCRRRSDMWPVSHHRVFPNTEAWEGRRGAVFPIQRTFKGSFVKSRDAVVPVSAAYSLVLCTDRWTKMLSLSARCSRRPDPGAGPRHLAGRLHQQQLPGADLPPHPGDPNLPPRGRVAAGDRQEYPDQPDWVGGLHSGNLRLHRANHRPQRTQT